MLLSFEQTQVQLLPEFTWEFDLLQSDGFKSKLSYEIMAEFPDHSDIWSLHYETGKFVVDRIKKEIIIPANIPAGAMCYALRAVTDGILLDYGKTPFHCAAVSSQQKQLFFFAGSGQGKSYFADYICAQFRNFHLIGDDHIIVTENHVVGNAMRRLRNKRGETVKYTKNTEQDRSVKKIGLCIHHSTQAHLEELPNDRVYESLLHATALKYIMTEPVFEHNLFPIKEIFGSDKKAQYQRLICTNAANFDRLFIINGSFHFIEQEISKIINILLDG